MAQVIDLAIPVMCIIRRIKPDLKIKFESVKNNVLGKNKCIHVIVGPIYIKIFLRDGEFQQIIQISHIINPEELIAQIRDLKTLSDYNIRMKKNLWRAFKTELKVISRTVT